MIAPGRFNRRITAVAGAAAMIFLILSCSGEGDGGKRSGGDTAVESGSDTDVQDVAENTYKGSVADVTFRTLGGSEKKITDYGNKILVVNYLATWNEDSKKLVPIMNEVQRKFHANVIVLGVVIDIKSAGQMQVFKKAHDVKFELLLPGGDPGRFGNASKLPTSHIVTRDDYLLSSFKGLFRAKKYEEMILAMYRRRM